MARGDLARPTASWCPAGSGCAASRARSTRRIAREHECRSWASAWACSGGHRVRAQRGRACRANSSEFDPATVDPVIDLLPEQKKVTDIGGTMRLGADPATWPARWLATAYYEQAVIYERHRHRWEVNTAYHQASRPRPGDLRLSPDGRLVEIIELPATRSSWADSSTRASLAAEPAPPAVPRVRRRRSTHEGSSRRGDDRRLASRLRAEEDPHLRQAVRRTDHPGRGPEPTGGRVRRRPASAGSLRWSRPRPTATACSCGSSARRSESRSSRCPRVCSTTRRTRCRARLASCSRRPHRHKIIGFLGCFPSPGYTDEYAPSVPRHDLGRAPRPRPRTGSS